MRESRGLRVAWMVATHLIGVMLVIAGASTSMSPGHVPSDRAFVQAATGLGVLALLAGPGFLAVWRSSKGWAAVTLLYLVWIVSEMQGAL